MSAIPIFFDLTSLTIAQGTTYQRLRQICNSDCEYPSLGGYTMDVSHTPRKIKYKSSNQIPPETFVMISSVSALSLCRSCGRPTSLAGRGLLLQFRLMGTQYAVHEVRPLRLIYCGSLLMLPQAANTTLRQTCLESTPVSFPTRRGPARRLILSFRQWSV